MNKWIACDFLNDLLSQMKVWVYGGREEKNWSFIIVFALVEMSFKGEDFLESKYLQREADYISASE